MMTSRQYPWTHTETVSCSRTLLFRFTGNESVTTRESFAVSSSLAFEASGYAVSVGIVGPLSLGEDERALTGGPGGVKNLDVTAPMEIQGSICQPKSVSSFKGDHRCDALLPSGSQAVTSSSLAEGTPGAPHLPPTTTGVTEVVAMAEVSVAKIDLQLPETQARAVDLHTFPF